MYKYRSMTPEEQKKVVEERWAKGVPIHKPPHFIESGQLYLLTAACYEHKPIMQIGERRQQLQQTMLGLAPEFDLPIHAWVVLNNHYHLLAEVLCADTLSKFFQKLHGGLAFLWNGEDNARSRQVWFRYSDRHIRNERHYYTAINYLHYNPVKHGLVVSPYDHAESSVHSYLADFGREWLRDTWQKYPVLQFGEKWDIY